jgi:phage N-6-adenine-methyltransferase
MGSFEHKFDSAKQEWTTPQTLFDRLNQEFHFTIDLAADATNTKCKQYFDAEKNGLLQSWKGVGWLNPPYGAKEQRLEHWVKKAHSTQQQGNATVVMLIPARTNTRWWHQYCMAAAEVRFICGRPKFGSAEHGLPQPLALVVFRKHQEPTQFGSFYLDQRQTPQPSMWAR